MIRFQPDTWRDAFWRPIAMAAPDAGVYIEIMAPDLRFVALLLLTLCAVLLSWRLRRLPLGGPLWPLVAFSWLAFVPWLATTGNGRYFIPVLMLVGPLCIALVYRLPVSRSLRLLLCVLLVGAQVIAVAEAEPRRRWSLMPWGVPYFQIDLTAADREQPAAWVMVTSLSYSLLAPRFDPRSRWMNVSGLEGGSSDNDRRAQRFLAGAVRDGLPLRLLLHSDPRYADEKGQPVARMREELDRHLAPHRMGLSGACETRRSQTMIDQMIPDGSSPNPRRTDSMGFWVCPLAYPVAAPIAAGPSAAQLEAARVFERLEQECPRLFPPGGGRTVRMEDGFMRDYPGADVRAYVLDDGAVRFKYWRALNPNLVGTVADVLAPGFRLDCHQVRGRSGLPWERRL